ncbi:GrpB family protein [Actinopolymorpha sp. B17G11]|uniref:GrpB family protein n=1 Tax=Actinopolymorpha sp. B17G11 TaxID=3160861 RepID=UPI0032E4E120
MPFPDELHPAGVTVHPYNPAWPGEAATLGAELAALVPRALAVEHIGSTAISGMAAKDCLDMMILVNDLNDSNADPALTAAGYRRLLEPWNNLEEAIGRHWPKLVFAPPIGARPCNIHVRVIASETARIALLFRDHLRAIPTRTEWWSELKTRAAQHTTTLQEYGQIKYPAWHLLMDLAEAWAHDTGWTMPTYEPRPNDQTVFNGDGELETPVS